MNHVVVSIHYLHLGLALLVVLSRRRILIDTFDFVGALL